MEYLAVGIRTLVGIVFLAAVVGKVARRDGFSAFLASVQRMRILSTWRAGLVARVVVVGEVVICLLLAVPIRVANVAGLLLASGLLVAFSLGIVVSVRRGIHAPCRCFGASTTPLGTRHVVRNIGLAAAAAVGAVSVVGAAGPVHTEGVIVAAVAGLALGGVVIVLDDIIELFASTGRQAEGPRTRR